MNKSADGGAPAIPGKRKKRFSLGPRKKCRLDAPDPELSPEIPVSVTDNRPTEGNAEDSLASNEDIGPISEDEGIGDIDDVGTPCFSNSR